MTPASESTGDGFQLPVVRLSASGRLRGREFHFSPKQRKAAGAELSHAASHSRDAGDPASLGSSHETSSLPGVSASRESDACSVPVNPAELEVKEDEAATGGDTKDKASRRFKKTGEWKFRPFVYTENLEPTPDWDKSDTPESTVGSGNKKSPTGSRTANVPDYIPYGIESGRRRILWCALGVTSVIALIVGGYITLRERLPSSESVGKITLFTDPSARLNESAKAAFSEFLGTADPQALADHVIEGNERLPAIERYLKEKGPFPKPEELDTISSLPLSQGDLKKGIAALTYRREVRTDLLSAAPLIPLASRTNGSLERMAMVDTTLDREKPKQALALFKREGDRMLLDWDLFVQTWDRSLAAFRDGELGDGPMRFRVLVASDIPVSENGESLENAVFRIQDPVHVGDIIRVQTKGFSADERRLLSLDRGHAGAGGRIGLTRTATLDLSRDPATGRVGISRFVCWEFLGLGGVEQSDDREK